MIKEDFFENFIVVAPFTLSHKNTTLLVQWPSHHFKTSFEYPRHVRFVFVNVFWNIPWAPIRDFGPIHFFWQFLLMWCHHFQGGRGVAIKKKRGFQMVLSGNQWTNAYNKWWGGGPFQELFIQICAKSPEQRDHCFALAPIWEKMSGPAETSF